MTTERKKLLFWVGNIILLVGVFLLWRYFLGKAFLQINAGTDFAVITTEEQVITCETSPCNIEVKTGTQFLQIVKDGYITEQKTIKLGIREKVELNFFLLKKKDEISMDEILKNNDGKKVHYELVKSGNGFKLTRSGSKDAIVFFNKGFKNQKIFGSENRALIIEGEMAAPRVYIVNTVLKKRTAVSNIIGGIKEVRWSPVGSYALILNNGKWRLLKDNGEIIDKPEFENLQKIGWKDENTLMILDSNRSINELEL